MQSFLLGVNIFFWCARIKAASCEVVGV
uniref:Uncharacterized protein n=1 Tax=Rhizophora mucronata TaxID=61149 RepID=A0A2P2PX36_RHIMU